MNTVGFPISTKENENRRAIIPNEAQKLTHPEMVYIEKGFGKVLGIPDDDYVKSGCNICSRDECLTKDIICDPKVGDADYFDFLSKGQTIFGWIHAVQNTDIAQKIVSHKLSAYAWENMFEKGRHVFWFNNELAGQAAIMHGFQCFGQLPYGLDIAVIGNGNTARGAVKALNVLGANVFQYNRHQEHLLREEISKFDVIVNCILWDVERKDHIIYREDLKRMKKNAMIIDVSCDRNGGIETSLPTTIFNPTYMVDGILHYAVDHTPAIYYKTFSYENSKIIQPFIEQLITGKHSEILENSLIIKRGIILDNMIVIPE